VDSLEEEALLLKPQGRDRSYSNYHIGRRRCDISAGVVAILVVLGSVKGSPCNHVLFADRVLSRMNHHIWHKNQLKVDTYCLPKRKQLKLFTPNQLEGTEIKIIMMQSTTFQ
jgi:hypothetical protein